MATLAPNPQFNVAVESPVSSPDYGALGSVLGGFIGAGIESRAQGGGGNQNLDGALRNGMLKVRALYNEGRTQEATALETRITTNYVNMGGDLGSGNAKAIVEGTIGKPVENLGNTNAETAVFDLVNSEQFTTAMASTYAMPGGQELTPEARTEMALGFIAVQEANDQILEMAQFDWNAGGRAAFGTAIDGFESTIMGSLALVGQEGGDVTLEGVQQSKQQFLTFRSQLVGRKPPNVPPNEWDSVIERLNGIEATFDYLETLAGPGNLSARSLSNFMGAVADMGFPAPEEALLMSVIQTNPETLVHAGVIGQDEWVALLESVKTTGGGPTPGAIRNPTVMDPASTDDVNLDELDAIDTLEGARNAARVGTLAGNGLTQNEALRNDWGTAVSRSFARMEQLANKGEWLTDKEYQFVFNDDFFNNLESIKAVDPELYKAMSSRASKALLVTGTTLSERIKRVQGNSPFDYNIRTGQIRLTEEGIRRVTDANIADAVMDGVNEWYGGDLDAALADQGSAFYDAYDTILVSAWSSLTENGRVPKNLRDLVNSQSQIAALQARVSGVPVSDLDPTGGAIQSYESLPQNVQQDTQFLTATAGLASRLGANPDDLLRVMAFETANSFNPGLKHGNSNAIGLIGFMPDTARDLGTTSAALAKMNRVEQLQWVEKYLTPKLQGIQNPTFGDLYLAVHFPVAVGKGDDYVLYSASGDNTSKMRYNANSGLDLNGDGTVTAGEAVAIASGRTNGMSAGVDFGRAMMAEVEGAQMPAADAARTAPQMPGGGTPTPVEAAPNVQDPSGQVLAAQGTPLPERRTASQASTQELMDRTTVFLLERMGLKPDDVQSFNSFEEVDKAADEGKLEVGSPIVINGRLMRYDG